MWIAIAARVAKQTEGLEKKKRERWGLYRIVGNLSKYYLNLANRLSVGNGEI